MEIFPGKRESLETPPDMGYQDTDVQASSDKKTSEKKPKTKIKSAFKKTKKSKSKSTSPKNKKHKKPQVSSSEEDSDSTSSGSDSEVEDSARRKKTKKPIIIEPDLPNSGVATNRRASQGYGVQLQPQLTSGEIRRKIIDKEMEILKQLEGQITPHALKLEVLRDLSTTISIVTHIIDGPEMDTLRLMKAGFKAPQMKEAIEKRHGPGVWDQVMGTIRTQNKQEEDDYVRRQYYRDALEKTYNIQGSTGGPTPPGTTKTTHGHTRKEVIGFGNIRVGKVDVKNNFFLETRN